MRPVYTVAAKCDLRAGMSLFYSLLSAVGSGQTAPRVFTLAVYGCFRTSGPSEMRHSCFFTAISIALLGISGCKMADTGPTGINPATNVDYSLATFTLQDT